MILVDANLLLYAKHSGYAEHRTARAWFDARLGGPGRVGLPWPSLLAFLRLSANPRVLERPLPMDRAWRQVREWLALPSTWIPVSTEDHERVLDRLVVNKGLSPKLAMDAHLAALAIEHGLVLCSADGDFARFEGLRFENPLSG